MTTVDKKKFSPNWYSAPGETISTIMGERKLSNGDFAHQMGLTIEQVDDLIHGRFVVTSQVAKKLEKVVGGTVSFWINRETQYREDQLSYEKREQILTEQSWLRGLPINDMVKMGWLKPATSLSSKVRECLKFFDVPDINTWRENYRGVSEAVAFRTSNSFVSIPGAVIAWLRQGEIKSATINCEEWNKRNFQKLLPVIRSLTRKKDPNIFIPELTRLCASCGVALVVLRAPKGCRASGATCFLSPTKAMILLSFRYLSDDHFWFSFFHEAGHLILHNKDAIFLEGSNVPLNKEEEECNRFASDVLVPTSFQEEMMALRHHGRDILRFARKIGIAPGLVVGQLQYLNLVKPNRLNYLKRRFAWVS